MKKYDQSLGRKSSAGNTKKVERKLRLGTSNNAAEVQKLQQELAGYVGSINVALGLYNMRASALKAKQAQSSGIGLKTEFVIPTGSSRRYKRL